MAWFQKLTPAKLREDTWSCQPLEGTMPRTSRKSSALSGSLHPRARTLYALAASAAGVGMLALAQPAGAKIVYTPAHKSITPNHTIPLDLNHDGTVDFRLKDIYYTSQFVSHVGILSAVPAVHANEIEGYSKVWHYASALRAGVSIGPRGPFKTGARLMARVFSDDRRSARSSARAAPVLGPSDESLSRFEVPYQGKGSLRLGPLECRLFRERTLMPLSRLCLRDHRQQTHRHGRDGES